MAVEVGRDELRRDLGDDGVAITAQAHHSGGNPMSQREKCGFSWYATGFSVSAVDEGEVIPDIAAILGNCFWPPSLLSVDAIQ